MTREQIEKAGRDYALDQLGIVGLPGRAEAMKAFISGVQWRINSVWHKPSAYGEELTRNVEVVAKTKRGYRFGKFDVVGYSNEHIGFVSTSRLEYALSDVLEYAYLDDLLPERKEDTDGGR